MRKILTATTLLLLAVFAAASPVTAESTPEAQQWLETMADMALSDGRVDRAEAALLVQAGERIDWTAYDLQALLKRRKKALYKAARQQLSRR